jgi:hypothetical protein
MDGFIAATALVHDLTVVTRNTKDFGAAVVPGVYGRSDRTSTVWGPAQMQQRTAALAALAFDKVWGI